MRKAVLAVLFVFCTLAFIPATLHAATEEPSAPETSPTTEEEEKIATDSGMPEYKLPHPGMLPDNPLYKLKTLRDKVTLFMIRNPEAKAEKHLAFADRMFMEALKLAEKDNLPLAIHTAFKAEHHMTELVNNIRDATYGDKDLNQALIDRAHQAAGAHHNILAGIRARTEDNSQQKEIDTILEFSARNDDTLTTIEKEEMSGFPDELLPEEAEGAEVEAE